MGTAKQITFGLVFTTILVMFATACSTTIPRSALALSPQSLEMRQLQTRRYATRDEAKLLSASAGLLQDLGFAIDNSETRVGLIAASKDRDATDGGQVAGAVMVAILSGASTPIDDFQKIRACVVTRPIGSETTVRVTFQRVVWNTNGQISRLEKLEDPEMYQEFFEKLSKSIFLEGQQI